MDFEKEEAFFTHCVLYIPETKDAEHPEPKAASRRVVSCWQVSTRTKTGQKDLPESRGPHGRLRRARGGAGLLGRETTSPKHLETQHTVVLGAADSLGPSCHARFPLPSVSLYWAPRQFSPLQPVQGLLRAQLRDGPHAGFWVSWVNSRTLELKLVKVVPRLFASQTFPSDSGFLFLCLRL